MANGADLELNFEQRALVDRFRDLIRETRAVAGAAPRGGILDAIESCVASRGLDLLRLTIESEAQAAIDEAEKKRRLPALR